MVKLSTEEFIEKARKVHGDKYDYSKVEYKHSKEKVCIVCPKHGEFLMKPNDHLNGKGCRYCVNNKPLTTEIFIERAKKRHGDKYDYSKVKYVNANTKVCIICPIHGEFWQKPYDHLIMKGCPRCASKYMTLEEFIRKAKEIHKDKYDYSEVEFVNMGTKVKIICPKHGGFYQTPTIHLQGCGCKQCGVESSHDKQRSTKESFVEKARKVHGDKYDYSKIEYVNNHTKVCIICPTHGEFWQTPSDHIEGKGCRKCGYKNVSRLKGVPFNEFVERASKIHNNKYEYDESTYKNCSYKMRIICPKHGEFWQTPDHHLQGTSCPHCNESKLERDIECLLKENNIEYIRGYKTRWLLKQHIDFYLPKYNLGIECQGEQHYMEKENWCRDSLSHRIELDNKKLKLCKENGITILYYSDKQYNDNIFIDKNKLLEKIVE